MPGGPQPDHRIARDVFAAVVLVRDGRYLEAVADKLHVFEGPLLLPADIPGKADAIAVREGPALAADLHSHRRMAGGFDADDADGLKVGAVIAGRLHAPRLEVVLDVGGGQANAGAEDGASLEVVGGDVSEPFPQVAGIDMRGAAPAGGLRRADRDQGGQNRRHDRHPAAFHATPIGLTICRLAMTIDFR